MATRILLVDDDGDDTWLFMEALRGIDPSIVCICATDGQEGLDKLKEIEPPGVIFLDINMPIMNGWDCLKAIKSNNDFKNIPVIMYSTSSHMEDISKAFDLGILCFFSKPFDFKNLAKTLEVIVSNLKEGTLASMPAGNKHLRFRPVV